MNAHIFTITSACSAIVLCASADAYDLPFDIVRKVEFGGYINALGHYEDLQPRALGATPAQREAGSDVDFQATADLDMNLHFGQSVTRFEIQFGDDEASDTNLEQAYIRYHGEEDWYVQLGRFHAWMGWERYDAPQFWRVNPTYTYYNTGM